MAEKKDDGNRNDIRTKPKAQNENDMEIEGRMRLI